MRMSGLSESEKALLLDFDGYGVADPDVVFIGQDEYVPGSYDGQRENIRIRCSTDAFRPPLGDAREALFAVVANVGRERVPTWEIMSALLARLNGTTEDEEQKWLGRRSQQCKRKTWLTDVWPLPCPYKGTWKDSYIREYFGDRYRRRTDFFRDTARLKRIAVRLRKQRPGLVITYGRVAERAMLSELSSEICLVEHDSSGLWSTYRLFEA